MSTGARTRWAQVALVGFVALGTFLPSLSNGFALDDVPAVEQDERIRDLRNVPGLLAQPYLTYLPVERSPYRPVTTASYALSWAAGDGAPWAFHATNVALHVAASLALLSLLGALGVGGASGAAAALLFAVHPVHVEAVAGIVGRADVLSTLFALLALRLHLAASAAPMVRAFGVGVLYLFALGSKEGAVVLPVLLLLVEWVRPALALRDSAPPPTDGGPTSALTDSSASPPEEAGWIANLHRVLSVCWPALLTMSAALALFLSVRTWVLGGITQLDIAAYIAVLPAGTRIATAIANLGVLTRLLLFPVDLSPDYGPGLITPAGLTDLRFWFGALLGGAALVLVVRALLPRTGARDSTELVLTWIGFGIAWIAASYALVSNILLPMPMWIAERTLYLPSVGLCIAIAGVLAVKRPQMTEVARRATAAALGVLLLAGALHSATHSRTWENDEVLFTDLASRHPESFRAQWWVGGRFMDQGDLERGLTWLERAVESSPNSALIVLDYCRALLLAERSVEAEALLRPIPAPLHPSRSVYLAQSLIFQGRAEEAADVVREGLRLFPDDARLIGQARELGLEEG